jgi:hypothetical protein
VWIDGQRGERCDDALRGLLQRVHLEALVVEAVDAVFVRSMSARLGQQCIELRQLSFDLGEQALNGPEIFHRSLLARRVRAGCDIAAPTFDPGRRGRAQAQPSKSCTSVLGMNNNQEVKVRSGP